MRIAMDRRFLAIAGIPVHRHHNFRQSLKDVRFCGHYPFFGGWAGYDYDECCLLALPSRFIWFTRDAVASHELFHYARHFTNGRRFNPPDSPPSLALTLVEELHVWGHTFRYAPFGTFFLFLSPAILIVFAAWFFNYLGTLWLRAQR